MKYLIFCQTPYNTVRYMTNDMQEYTSLSYKKFLHFLMSHKIVNYIDIQFHLDSFHTVLLDIETGEYKQLIPEKGTKPSFEELLEANQEAMKQVENEKYKTNDKPEDLLGLGKKKNYFDKLFAWRKDHDYVNRYRGK